MTPDFDPHVDLTAFIGLNLGFGYFLYLASLWRARWFHFAADLAAFPADQGIAVEGNETP